SKKNKTRKSNTKVSHKVVNTSKTNTKGTISTNQKTHTTVNNTTANNQKTTKDTNGTIDKPNIPQQTLPSCTSNILSSIKETDDIKDTGPNDDIEIISENSNVEKDEILPTKDDIIETGTYIDDKQDEIDPQ